MVPEQQEEQWRRHFGVVVEQALRLLVQTACWAPLAGEALDGVGGAAVVGVLVVPENRHPVIPPSLE